MNQNESMTDSSSGYISNQTKKKHSFFGALYTKIHNVLFPAKIKCIVCGDDLPEIREIEVCDKCKNKLEFIAENECCQCCGAPIVGEAKYCFNCKDNTRDFDLSRSVFVYEGEVVKLIAGLKFSNKPYLARTLGRYLAELYKELGWQIDCVVPVPITLARRKWRGYNQAELLAEEFCEVTKLPLNTEILIKPKDTEEQKELNMQERQKNIQNAFKVTDKYFVKNRNVLIIDDVMTTGATASACAEALKKAHAKHVFVLCVAHGRPQIPSQNSLKDVNSVINSVK